MPAPVSILNLPQGGHVFTSWPGGIGAPGLGTIPRSGGKRAAKAKAHTRKNTKRAQRKRQTRRR